MRPERIEALSFRMIEEEAGLHGFTPRQWQVVRRMIHTSADFDYLKTVRFHKKAIDAGLGSIKQGKTIFTDTHMVCAGIRKNDLAAFGCEARCLISDPEVVRMASRSGSTRASAAVDCAAGMMTGGIYVVGNAPTALLRLIQLIDQSRAGQSRAGQSRAGQSRAGQSRAGQSRAGQSRAGQGRAAPALVVGLPVGFVNAAESKEALVKTRIPYITNTGRKGGSNLAASVVNALIIMAGSYGALRNDEKR